MRIWRKGPRFVSMRILRILVLTIAVVTAIGVSYSILPAQVSRSVWDGVYTSAQADRGAGFYTQYCSACHGESLGGNDEAPPLAGADFLSNWNGLTVGDLFERIRTTMPLNKPQSLSRETNVSILAHLLRANKFPPGETGLPGQTEAMKQVRIDAVKPGKER